MTVTSAADTAPAAGTGIEPRPGGSRRLVAGLLVTGFVLVQLAWLLTIPPFRGVDEFDHAYRAAAVARGEWVPPVTAATRGTGAFVSVPRDIVEAAGPQCSALPYTTSVDCEPGEGLGDGLVSVASGAGRYNPVYYALVGTAALPFDGFAALYAMRLASIALCAALVAAAAWSLVRWARGPTPVLGLVVASSPVFIYSSSIVAPNGLEMTAALAVWAGLWGLLRDDRNRRGHLVVATIGACTLATVRSLGPLWLLLVVVAVLAAAGPLREVWARVRTLARWRPALVATGITGLSVLASCAWILAMSSLALSQENLPATDLGDRVEASGTAVRLWVLQSIAAFPTRSEPAPVVVYAAGLVAFVALLVVAAVTGRRRLVVVATVTALVSILVPFVITVATFDSYAVAWQGRYTLPLSVGIPLLLAMAVDRRPSPRTAALTVLAATLLLGVAHVVSVADVTAHERVNSPLAGTGDWLMPPVWLVSVMAAGGVLVMCWAAWKTHVGPAASPPGPAGRHVRLDPVWSEEPAQT